MKKNLAAILIGCIVSSGLWCQMSYDTHLANINFLGGSNVHCFGLGGSYYKAVGAKFLIGITANIYFGGKQKDNDTAHAVNSYYVPQTVLIPVTRKVISYTGDLDFRYYLVGDAESDLAVYGIAGGGVLKGLIRTKTVGTYDNSYYYNNETVGDQGDFTAVAVNFGAGLEKNIGNNYIFLNARYHYVAKYFADGPAYFAPKSLITIDFGLRVPFGGR